MTEQPPSADDDLREWFWQCSLNLQNAAIKSTPQIAHPCDADHFADDAMRRVDALIAQRVSAETERILNLCVPQEGEAWSREAVVMAEVIRDRARAPAERPAPPWQSKVKNVAEGLLCNCGLSDIKDCKRADKCKAEPVIYYDTMMAAERPAPEAAQGTDRPVSGSREPGWFWVRWKSGPPTDFDGGWYIARRHSVIDAHPQNDYWDKGPWFGQGAPFDEIGPRILPPSALASTGDCPVSGDIVRWGVLRLLSGDLASDDERVDAELDLDDFQFWFQENPKHTGFRQILINLSGEQWAKLKELALVEERSPQPAQLASTGEQPDKEDER